MHPKYLTSLQNPLVKHLVKLRTDRDYRYEQNSLIIEGLKPVQELAPYIKKLFYTESFPIPSFVEIEQWIVTDAIMKKISGMTSSEGILAEVQMPLFSTLEKFNYIVVFDGINDPGNLGTLLRTALALGWEGAYILPNSCDPFNEKALRAARGAHFRLPIACGTVNELQALVQKKQLIALVADLEGQAPESIPKEKGRVLVLGNEAHGASPEILQFCSKVTIPMPGEMESLNVAVAGGILMYILLPPRSCAFGLA